MKRHLQRNTILGNIRLPAFSGPGRKHSGRFPLVLFLLAMTTLAGAAQASGVPSPFRSFDRPTWQRATEGLDYGPLRQPDDGGQPATQESPRDSAGDKNRRQPLSRFLKGGGAWLGLLAKLFLFLGGAFLLFLLLKGLLGLERPPRNRRLPGAEPVLADLEHLEDDLPAHDLPAYIRQALAAERYDLAVRLHYLAVLKELSSHRLIRWKKEKTNEDYLREMRRSDLFPSFSALTQRFERIWYGKQAPTADDYPKIERQFQQFTARLGSSFAYEAQP